MRSDAEILIDFNSNAQASRQEMIYLELLLDIRQLLSDMKWERHG